jgi:hypothetical protein
VEGGDWQGGATAGCQNVIFGVMSEVQKDSEDIFAGLGF